MYDLPHVGGPLHGQWASAPLDNGQGYAHSGHYYALRTMWTTTPAGLKKISWLGYTTGKVSEEDIMELRKLESDMHFQAMLLKYEGRVDTASTAAKMLADVLGDLFALRRVPQLFTVRRSDTTDDEGNALPPTYRVTRNVSGGMWPWPSVTRFSTWENAMGFIDEEIAWWCKAELVARGFRVSSWTHITGDGPATKWGWIVTKSAVCSYAHDGFPNEAAAWHSAWQYSQYEKKAKK
jgi:hypothetical protein